MAKRKRPEIAGVGEQIFSKDQDGDAPELLPEVSSVHIEDLPVIQIDPNPYQPRTQVTSDDALHELAASIRERGLLQPIRVRPHGERYQLIAGERRWWAAQLAGFKSIPAIIVEIDDAAMRIEAIMENIQREDLNEIERAKALRELKTTFGLTWTEVADKVGLTRRSVMRIVGLTSLPPDVQQMIADGRLSEKHGRALRKLNDDPEKMAEVAQIAANEGLSGEETNDLVKSAQGEPNAKTPKPVADAVAVIGRSSANLSRLFAKLVDAPMRKRDQKQLKDALTTLEEVLRSLHVLCDE